MKENSRSIRNKKVTKTSRKRQIIKILNRNSGNYVITSTRKPSLMKKPLICIFDVTFVNFSLKMAFPY